MSKITSNTECKRYHFNIPSKYNQDRSKRWTIDDNGTKTIVTVVCDGHGKFGERYANFTIDYLIKNLSSINFESDDVFKLINQLIVDLDINCKKSIGHLNGGSTLSIIIETQNFNLIVNVGDSEIVLFNSDEYEILSEDHSPDNISEFKRMIGEKEGIIFEYDKKIKWGYNKYNLYEKVENEWYKKEPPTSNVYVKDVRGRYATYLGDGVNKLSMTRAIGDYEFKEKLAVSNIPYIRKISKLNENQSIIIASDGFWDCWTLEELIDIINNQKINELQISHILKSNKLFGSAKDDAVLYYLKQD